MAQHTHMPMGLNSSEDDDTLDYWTISCEPGEEGADMMRCVGLTIHRLSNVDAWLEWMAKEITGLPDASTRTGFTVMLCPKTRPPTGRYPWKDPPVAIRNIPLSETVFHSVGTKFNIHPKYFAPLRVGSTHMATPDPKMTRPSSHSALFQSNITNYPGSIALAYTYFPSVKSSCGIFFGCEKDDVEATLHIQELGNNLIGETLTVDGDIMARRSTHKYFQPSKLTERLSNIVTDVKIFEEDVAKANRQLKGLMNCVPRSGRGDTRNKNYMLRKQLEQMSCQYDDLSGTCRVCMETARLNAETHATSVSKHIAMGSMVLAFAAVLFMPIATIASIFSMPIFDYKADWKDIRGRPAPKAPEPTHEHPRIDLLLGRIAAHFKVTKAALRSIDLLLGKIAACFKVAKTALRSIDVLLGKIGKIAVRLGVIEEFSDGGNDKAPMDSFKKG
ncbi:hypothetical protein O1611_g6232 [Lasiodiplodia mahajangana]|uniref:Uncharacterized protein n=1 Tax=Lasiodiplodia mahajangana TaxID=1108764 RepID=A0ACC2JJ72_9PEZI|nr:hypothetical protein O1611_g6232 [Lasiodiplodia mahajangana]